MNSVITALLSLKKVNYEIIDDLDSLSTWTSSDSSKLLPELTNETLISGSKCHKLIFSGADSVVYKKNF